jgi:hypothetical protein
MAGLGGAAAALPAGPITQVRPAITPTKSKCLTKNLHGVTVIVEFALGHSTKW